MHHARQSIALTMLLLAVAAPLHAGETYVFDGQWGTRGSSLGQFDLPHGLTCDTAGNLFVTDWGNHRVQVFTQTGTTLYAFGVEGDSEGLLLHPWGIWLAGDGYLYMTDVTRAVVQKRTTAGALIKEWGGLGTDPGKFNKPTGIVVSSRGYVYVSDWDNHRIQRFDRSGKFISTWGTYGTGDGQLKFPYNLACDSSGNVYVCDAVNHRIQKFAPDGTFLAKWGSSGTADGQFNHPTGIAVDAEDCIYVSEFYGNRIQKFASDMSFICKWGSGGGGPGEFNNPHSLAVAASGYVFVSDQYNYRLQRFSPPDAPTRPTRVTITPADPVTGQRLTAQARGATNPGGTPPSYQYEWARGLAASGAGARAPGRVTSWEPWGHASTDGVLADATPSRGEVWRARARATDGVNYSGWVESDVVLIGNAAPTRPTSVVVTPEDPLDASNLTATATGSTDPDSGDAVDYQYQWNKSADGGVTWPYAGSGPAVSGARTAEGEQWRVRARATDGVGYSEWSYSAPVTIGGNSPPTRPTGVVVRPDDPLDASDLTAHATGSTDPDGDETVTYQYQWNKSSDGGVTWPYAGHGPTVPAARTTAGEQWRVRARATDGIAVSEWRYGTPVTIGGNSPPTRPTAVVVSPERPGDTDDLTATATGSTDPDGDATISYQYQWNKSVDNGQTWRYAGCGPTIWATATTFGELWRVRARASDGIAQSEWRYGTPVFIVGNAAPTRPTDVVVSPSDPADANDLTAEATGSTDPDSGDTVSYQYQWSKSVDGGVTWAYAGCGPTVPAGKTAEGELWRARARATDGTAYSEWRYSAPVTIGGVWESQIATVTASAAPARGGVVPITVNLSTAATVQVTVVNIAGRTVAVLPECALVRGSSTLLWNGRSTSGTRVPTGSYFVNVTARTAEGQQSRTCTPLRLTR